MELSSSSRWKEGEGFRLNHVYRKFALLFVDAHTLSRNYMLTHLQVQISHTQIVITSHWRSALIGVMICMCVIGRKERLFNRQNCPHGLGASVGGCDSISNHHLFNGPECWLHFVRVKNIHEYHKPRNIYDFRFLWQDIIQICGTYSAVSTSISRLEHTSWINLLHFL